MFRGGGSHVHVHSHYHGSYGSDSDEYSVVVLIIAAIILICWAGSALHKCSAHTDLVDSYRTQIDADETMEYRSVYCDYDEDSKYGYTKISGLDVEYSVMGDADNIVDNKLVLKGNNNKVVAYVDNTTNVVNEDEHSIIIDDQCVLIVVSGYNTANRVYDYKLYAPDGTYKGRAEYTHEAEAGLIYNENDVPYVLFESNTDSNTYSLDIYRDDVLSDREILMINAIYISDWMKGEAV